MAVADDTHCFLLAGTDSEKESERPWRWYNRMPVTHGLGVVCPWQLVSILQLPPLTLVVIHKQLLAGLRLRPQPPSLQPGLGA